MCAELEKLHTQAPAHTMPHTETAILEVGGARDMMMAHTSAGLHVVYTRGADFSRSYLHRIEHKV